MLVNLVRSSVVARLLGVPPQTAIAWARAIGLELVRSPKAGNGIDKSPAYLTVPQALDLIDRMLPRALDRAANRRCKQACWRAAGRLADSTRNLTHG